MATTLPPVAYVMRNVLIQDGCWGWRGAVQPTGYYKASRNRKGVMAHRLVYEVMRGERIPEGLQLDHLCRNRGCVNPWHLEPVTIGDNIRRGLPFRQGPTACPSGHPYTADNTLWRAGRAGNPNRRCRKCHADRERARRVA